MGSKKIWIGLLIIALVGIGTWRLVNSSQASPTAPTSSVAPSRTPSTTPIPTPVTPKPPQASHTDPQRISVLVNKQNQLQPPEYVPNDLVSTPYGGLLRKAANDALNALLLQADIDGAYMHLNSGYRSYATQVQLYNNYVAKDGQVLADTYSARPGYSEHQTGLAADLLNDDNSCSWYICFADTPGGAWLAKYAQNWGFIIRYPNGKTDITGYQYEPWHLRYIGVSDATAIYNQQTTLEQYFGYPPAPVY